MKKRPLIFAYSAFIFALAMLGSFKIAKAASLYDQTDTSQTLPLLGDGGNPGIFEFNVTGIPTSTVINEISIPIDKNTCSSNNHPTVNFQGTNYNADATVDNISSMVNFPISPAATTTSSTFLLDVRIDCGSGQALIKSGDSASSTYVQAYNFVVKYGTGSTPTTDYCGGAVPCPVSVTSKAPAVFFNGVPSDLGTINLPDNQIIFQNPPFSDNMTVADFGNWQFCFNGYVHDPPIPSSAWAGSWTNSTNAGFYVRVAYGTSTPMAYDDVMTWSSGEPQYLNPYSPSYYSEPGRVELCSALPKKHDLPAGSYIAQANLWFYGLDGESHYITSSEALHFTINGNASTTYANEIEKPQVTCNFTLSNTGVSTVDDVVNGTLNGACKILTYLLVPQQSDFQQFSGLWTAVKTKPPIGYFTNSETQIAGLSTSTDATVVLPDIGLIGIFKTAIDAGIALLVGVSFLFFLWHRFRKFEFHH